MKTRRSRSHGIEAYITLELFNLQGKRIAYRRFRSRSFVQAFAALLLVQLTAEGTTPTIPDINNTNYTLAIHSTNFTTRPESEVLGIVVGSGSTAVAVTDYKLGTKIAHGTGSGQLSHGLQVFSALSVSNPNASFTFRRDFTNSSGGSITVNEVGLYLYGYGNVASRTFLAIRDIITGGQAVADGANLRVTYTIQTST